MSGQYHYHRYQLWYLLLPKTAIPMSNPFVQSVSMSIAPVSNTGLNMTEKNIKLGIDWLRGTFPSSQFAALQSLVFKTFSSPCEPCLDSRGNPISSRFYRFTYRSGLGIFIGQSNTAMSLDSAKQHIYLDIPASAISTISYENLSVFMAALSGLQFSCSRIDLKVDDYDKIITPEVAYDSVRSRNFSGLRAFRWLCSGYSGAPDDSIGSTLELGRRGKNGSGKFIRIYNKSIESKGLTDCTRIELELSDTKAKDAFMAFSSFELSSWSCLILGFLKNSVSFIDRLAPKKSGRADRCPLLDWWAYLVESVQSIPFTPRVVVCTYEKSKLWIEKQVLPTLAFVLNGIYASEKQEGCDFILWDWWKEGEKRMNDNHWLLLNDWCHRIGVIPHSRFFSEI
jgi:hypothetical protein